jgi:hypothetical protein
MAIMLDKEKIMSKISINIDSLNPTNYKKTVRHKIKEGDNVLRFLPPFGEEANGSPYVKWGVIWGLKDPTSGRTRPYASSSTYEYKCPVYDYLDALKPQVEAYKNNLLANGLTEDQVKEQMKPLNEFISDIRPKTVFAYNAVDQSGQLGVAEIKSTAHKKILKLMRDYINDYSQDPTSLNDQMNDSGVWFKITRSGAGFDTTYDAFKNQIKVKDENTGALTYQDDRSALPENVQNNYEELAYDLTGLYQKLTYDELREVLVANIISFAAETGYEVVLLDGFGLGENPPNPVPPKPPIDDVNNNLLQGNNPVNLNLGEDNPPNPVPPKPPIDDSMPPNPVPPKPPIDDVMKLADDIFNS